MQIHAGFTTATVKVDPVYDEVIMVQEIEVKQNIAYGTARAAVSTQFGEQKRVCGKEESTTYDYI